MRLQLRPSQAVLRYPDAVVIRRDGKMKRLRQDRLPLYTDRDNASATFKGNDIGPVRYNSLRHCRPAAETQKRHERHHVTY